MLCSIFLQSIDKIVCLIGICDYPKCGNRNVLCVRSRDVRWSGDGRQTEVKAYRQLYQRNQYKERIVLWKALLQQPTLLIACVGFTR
jgi:hypothetical protein